MAKLNDHFIVCGFGRVGRVGCIYHWESESVEVIVVGK